MDEVDRELEVERQAVIAKLKKDLEQIKDNNRDEPKSCHILDGIKKELRQIEDSHRDAPKGSHILFTERVNCDGKEKKHYYVYEPKD